MQPATLSIPHGLPPDGAGQRTSLSVLVPVYNEQYLVAASLRRLAVPADSPLLSRIQVIIVDDCSKDKTRAVLEKVQKYLPADPTGKFNWQFLRHERNLGKGAAVRTAIEHAECELTVIHDADLEYHPRDLLQMIPLFFQENADAVFGSRFMAGGFKRALFFKHSIGNHILTFLCNLASDLNLTDMETCYKMVRTDLLKSIPQFSGDFRIEPELTIELAKRGAHIFEVPISYFGRTYQEGKKIGWKDGVCALLAIVNFAASDRICKPDQFVSEVAVRLGRAPNYTNWVASLLRPHVGDNKATRPYLEASFIDPSDPSSIPSDLQFDTVICQNVLEHVDDDVAVLRAIGTMVRDGARIITLTPNGPGLFGNIDQNLGHRRRYSTAGLRALAANAGMRCVSIVPYNRACSLPWWLAGRVLGRAKFSLFQVKFVNLAVPLLRRIDNYLPMPAMSLVGVFEKVRGTEVTAEAVSDRHELESR